MNEFDLIGKYFVPLTERFSGSLALSDDAAVFSIPAGHDLVVTKDAISEGVHYLPGTDPVLIARKLLRTNLSDLAAMGANPLCYFLAIALPTLDEDFIRRFAEGLGEDQKTFGIYLAGGDTIATKGAPVFSLTAHGLVPQGQALRRSGAKAGDAIYVSGTLGDAALGLHSSPLEGGGREGGDQPQTQNGERPLPNPPPQGGGDYLTNRYHLPQPRLALGKELRGIATSCIDISDGLVADMGHVCKASGVGAEIHLEQLPLSGAAKNLLAESPDLWPLVYTGGDDYELLFTLPDGATPPEGVTRIGRIVKGPDVRLLNNGKEVTVSKTGYSH